MRRRLFWKILFGFWLTFFIMTQIMWISFTFYRNTAEPPENSAMTRLAEMQLISAATVLQTGGRAALESFISHWPESDSQYFSIEPFPLAEPKIEHHRGGEVSLAATAPDGQQYQLAYSINGLRKEYRTGKYGHFLNVPKPLLWMGGLGGLFFSALLAWNLTRPLRQLRAGLGLVAQGDLAVRLWPIMRRRNDEISDVARDFDSMAERLQVLVNAREQLLHDISHELRSPLARMQLAIGLARQNAQNVENSLQRIEHESERLDKMIGELLTLSRAQQGNGLDEEYFDLYGLTNTVVSDARYEAQATEVNIILQANSEQDYTVSGNAELMRRAIDNIVRNALRFSPPGEKVTVSLTRQEQQFHLQVSDHGPGVDERLLSSIFDPYVRVESPLSGKGYGLGLAITRKVVMAHRGQVEARNGDSGGLIITLSLPAWRG